MATTTPHQDSTPACQKNPELFFSNFTRDQRNAQRICRSCPLLVQCATLALEHHRAGEAEYGVWAGMTPEQRDERTGRDAQALAPGTVAA